MVKGSYHTPPSWAGLNLWNYTVCFFQGVWSSGKYRTGLLELVAWSIPGAPGLYLGQ